METRATVQMKINKALMLKLCPTEEQKELLDKTFGCGRFVYNQILGSNIEREEKYIKPIKEAYKEKELKQELKKIEEKLEKDKEEKLLDKKTVKTLRTRKKEIKAVLKEIRELAKKERDKHKVLKLTDLKQKYKFLEEAVSQALSNASLNIENAFKRFFNGKAGFPNFHKKHERNSYKNSMLRQKFFNSDNCTVNLSKIGFVTFCKQTLPKWFKDKNTVIKSYVCSRTPTNEYYISIQCETIEEIPVKLEFNQINENQVIGLDFDCDDMYIDSNGKSAKKDFGFKKQKQEHAKKLAHLQRQLDRKEKDSKSYEEARLKLAKLNQHIANSRLDWIEKESLRLSRSYEVIGIEDLNIRAMMQGSKNAKNYEDISWGLFVRKLQWKASLYGKYVIKIERFFPSSQKCNYCKKDNKKVKNKHLEIWECPNCHAIHQRDVNAARNIKERALEILKQMYSDEAEECRAESKTMFCLPEKATPSDTEEVFQLRTEILNCEV